MTVTQIIMFILAGAANIVSIWTGTRTGALAEEITRLIAAGFLLAERLGTPVTEQEITKWKDDMRRRAAILDAEP